MMPFMRSLAMNQQERHRLLDIRQRHTCLRDQAALRWG
jgi:hypothetical protein